MAYVCVNYKNNSSAPEGNWVCSPSVNLQPSREAPASETTGHPNYCGQCVSFVRTACPTLPPTGAWKKGALVKGNESITAGTVIATFNAADHYQGHAAIYDGQTDKGINVYDQWVTPPNPKPIGPRLLRWAAHGNSNNGDNFYVVN